MYKKKYNFLNRKLVLLMLFMLFNVFCFSQNKKIDSLENIINSSSKNDSVKINRLIKLSRLYINENTNKAIEFQEEALKISKKINYKIGMIKSHNNLSKIYTAKSDFTIAISHANLAINLNNNEFQEELQLSYLLLGQCYLFLNNFTDSTKYLTQSLKIAEKLNDNLKIAKIYNNIAIIYNKQSFFDKEMESYNKALSYLNNDNSLQALKLKKTINSNTGWVYFEKVQYDKALQMFEESYAFDLKNNDKQGIALDTRSLASVFRETGNYEKALDYFKQSLFIYKELDNKSGQGDLYREIGNVYYLTNDLQKALSYTNIGLKISTQIGELESIKFCYENLAKINEKLGNFKEAYKNEKLFKKMSDSMFNTEIHNKVTQTQMTYEFEKKQELLKKSQKEKEEKAATQAKKQRNLIYAIGLTLFFLSLITLGIYYNLKNYKRQKVIVEKQNEQIQSSLTEKETLLREIHHRVKNNLQIISSLLNMQAQNIDDEQILQTIQEGQSRVEAMSLIHQNLYQSEQIDKVNIKNYLGELTNYLSKMYSGDANNVEVHINSQKEQFDFDTAIPLGLIVNELVTNAYKHAFLGKNKGTISIEILNKNNIDYELVVSNDGNKMLEDFEIEKSKSLGMKLITILSRQLRGSFSNISTTHLTKFKVDFKDLKEYQNR